VALSKKTFFVLDTKKHIICKNGELGISCNIVMSERVLYGGKRFYGQGIFFSFFFDRVFLYPVFQNYFTVFLLALSFDIMQDICRRPVNAIFVEIQSWYLK